MTPQALRDAMETHGDAVYRLALCRLQNTADAEDVYQDVFLRLFRSGSETWDSEHTKAWLLHAAVNRCTDVGRLRIRRGTVSLESLTELPAPPDGEAAALWAAVGSLPPKFRTVVHLHYAEGYSTEEIAAILRIPPATVRTRLRRGREKLKIILGGDEDG